MHWLDCTILALLAAAAMFGAWSGLLMQVFRVVGFAAAAYAAISLHPWVESWLRGWLLPDVNVNVCNVVAYSAVFVIVYVAIFIATRLLEHGIKLAKLQFYNRLLGAVLAAAKMTVLLGAICFGLERLPLQEAHTLVEQSVMAPLLAEGTEKVVNVVPVRYKDSLSDSWQHFYQSLL